MLGLLKFSKVGTGVYAVSLSIMAHLSCFDLDLCCSL